MVTTLLVIDAQKIYTDKNSELFVPGSDAIIARINKLIKLFDNKKWPMIYIRHMHKADGSDSGRMWDFTGKKEEIGFSEDSREVEYDDALLLVSKMKEIIKHRYSCFEGTNLLKYLRLNAIEKLVIVGFMTNFCCESTARSAHDLDYYVDFIMDATGCPDLARLSQQQIKAATCETLAVGFANILNTEKFIKLNR